MMKTALQRTFDRFLGRPENEFRIKIDGHQEVYQEIFRSDQAGAPLLIGIHGLGANESQMESLVGIQLNQPYTYVSLRAFHTHPTGGFGWFPFSISEDGFEVEEEVLAEAVDRIDRFIQTMIETYQADPERVVFVGYSQGGSLAFSYLLRHPDRIVASVATAGVLIEESKQWLRAGSLTGKHLFIGFGSLDPFITRDQMEAAQLYFSDAGALTSLNEYRIPHVVSEAEVEDIQNWLNTLF